MSVKERLKKYLKNEKIPISIFEKQVNASNGYVNSISRSIGIDKLVLISEKYSNLNLEWLLVERGEMLRDTVPSEVQKEEHEKLLQELDNKTKMLEIQEELITMLKKEIARLESNEPGDKNPFSA